MRDTGRAMARRTVAVLVLGGVLPMATLCVPGLAEVIWGAFVLVMLVIALGILRAEWVHTRTSSAWRPRARPSRVDH